MAGRPWSIGEGSRGCGWRGSDEAVEGILPPHVRTATREGSVEQGRLAAHWGRGPGCGGQLGGGGGVDLG